MKLGKAKAKAVEVAKQYCDKQKFFEHEFNNNRYAPITFRDLVVGHTVDFLVREKEGDKVKYCLVMMDDDYVIQSVTMAPVLLVDYGGGKCEV